MMGLVADTVKRRFKTNTVANNGTNPYYNSEPFVFPKVSNNLFLCTFANFSLCRRRLYPKLKIELIKCACVSVRVRRRYQYPKLKLNLSCEECVSWNQ